MAGRDSGIECGLREYDIDPPGVHEPARAVGLYDSHRKRRSKSVIIYFDVHHINIINPTQI